MVEEKKHRKKVERKKEKTIITCDECMCQFTGRICPQCGYRIKDWGKRIESAEAELIKLNDRRPKPATMEEKRIFYGMLEYERRMRHYQPGWTAHKYRVKFGVWPQGLKDQGPVQPNASFFNWIRYQNIKYHKGKAKNELNG